ncbi:hypothetical protein BS78_03G185800 [Paspalum vaginatum]|nr:hypothetical protein BS78_03G185800 [Paspalum vaginatum]
MISSGCSSVQAAYPNLFPLGVLLSQETVDMAELKISLLHALLTTWFLLFFQIQSGTAAATVPVAKSIRCVPRERDALLAFKAGLTDPDNYLSSWQGEDCCQWKGIRCSNHTGHVTELQLQSLHGFRGGQMSPSLLGLKNLRTLDLRGNNFSGAPIPDFIGGLNNLRNNPLRTTAANNQQSIYVHRQSWTLWASSCQQLLHE